MSFFSFHCISGVRVQVKRCRVAARLEVTPGKKEKTTYEKYLPVIYTCNFYIFTSKYPSYFQVIFKFRQTSVAGR